MTTRTYEILVSHSARMDNILNFRVFITIFKPDKIFFFKFIQNCMQYMHKMLSTNQEYLLKSRFKKNILYKNEYLIKNMEDWHTYWITYS